VRASRIVETAAGGPLEGEIVAPFFFERFRPVKSAPPNQATAMTLAPMMTIVPGLFIKSPLDWFVLLTIPFGPPGRCKRPAIRRPEKKKT